MKTALLIWNVYGLGTNFYLIKENEEYINKLKSCHNKIINDSNLEDDDFTWALSYLTEEESSEPTIIPDEELIAYGIEQKDVGSYNKFKISEEDLPKINQHIDSIIVSGIY